MVSGKLGIQDNSLLIHHSEGGRDLEFRSVLDQVFKAYCDTLSEDRRVLLNRYPGGGCGDRGCRRGQRRSSMRDRAADVGI